MKFFETLLTRPNRHHFVERWQGDVRGWGGQDQQLYPTAVEIFDLNTGVSEEVGNISAKGEHIITLLTEQGVVVVDQYTSKIELIKLGTPTKVK